jgi:hypothetical protein
MLISDIAKKAQVAFDNGDTIAHCAITSILQNFQEQGERARNYLVVEKLNEIIQEHESSLASMEEGNPGISILTRALEVLKDLIPVSLTEEETRGVLKSLCQKYRGNKELTLEEAKDILGINTNLVYSLYGAVWTEVKKEIEDEVNKNS